MAMQPIFFPSSHCLRMSASSWSVRPNASVSGRMVFVYSHIRPFTRSDGGKQFGQQRQSIIRCSGQADFWAFTSLVRCPHSGQTSQWRCASYSCPQLGQMVSISWLAIVVGFNVRVSKKAYGPQAFPVPALLDEVAGLGFDPINYDAFAIGSHSDVV